MIQNYFGKYLLLICFKGIMKINSLNAIGSASKTARFGASIFVKELKKRTAFLVLR